LLFSCKLSKPLPYLISSLLYTHGSLYFLMTTFQICNRIMNCVISCLSQPHCLVHSWFQILNTNLVTFQLCEVLFFFRYLVFDRDVYH
jgi:hypothetical protein